jgi:NADPH:quinone reductase-like Zn-dependent oxidoreductase
VIATARPGKEADFVSRFGAGHTVDFTGDVSAQVRSICPGGVDAAIHLAGDGFELAELVRAGGRFASTLGLGPDNFGDRDLQVTSVMAMPTGDVLDELAARALSGELEVPIERTYKLEEVPRALDDFAQGTLGKFGVSVS